MMKSMKKTVALVCVFVMLAALAACGSSSKNYSIIGTWKSDDGKISEITFNEDGSGSLIRSSEISVQMTYTIDGDKITVSTEVLSLKYDTEYTYTLSANKLTLTENGQTVELTRQN